MQLRMAHIVFSQVCILVLRVSVARSFFINGSDLAMLAFESQSGSYRIDLRNTSRVTHFKSKDTVSLDFGLEPHQIYWSDEKSINKLHISDGLCDEIAFRHDKINFSLTVDLLANKVYRADAAQDTIYVSDLRKRRKVKLKREDLYSPIAIVLNQGHIFRTADCCPRPKIETARLDGTDRKILVVDGIQSPSGLAIDKQDKKIYWAGIDANKYGIIEVISLEDLSRTVIFHRPDYQPFSLDVFEDYVYWSDLGKNAVLRINKSNGNGEEVIMAGLKEPKGLKILHQHEDIPGGNCVYNNGGCDHVCLNRLNPRGQVCVCEEGFELSEDEKTCTSYTSKGFVVKSLGQGLISEGNITWRHESPCSGKEFRVERTLYVNTWLLIIILLLLALVLGKRVFKKVYSWLKAIHSGDVQGTMAEDLERIVRTEEGFATDNTDIMHESALLLNYDDDSPELNQQVCTTETKGACVHRGNLPFKVQGDLVVYMNMDTVNMNTMSMNMNTTNNVELQRNGGVTVVGDKTNINYHQPPQ